jgi:DNA gyrase subunit A
LRHKFKLSEIQATAILDMPLRRLAALERKKIETEYKETLARIKFLEDLLKNPKKILSVIKEELAELKTRYDSPRRTKIVDQIANGKPVMAGDLIAEEAVVVAVSRSGRVCRWPAEEGLEPARGKQTDPLVVAVPAHTRDTLYLFTQTGRAVIIPMHQMPVGTSPGDGPSLSEFSSGSVQPVVAALALSGKTERSGYLCLVTQQGRVKRVLLSDLETVRGSEAVVIGLEKGDKLLTAFATPGNGDLLLVSAQGQAIRFAEEEVRPMGLPAAGVMGMKLAGNDTLVGGGLVKTRGDVALVSRQGIGKRIELKEFPKQGRHGQGFVVLKLVAGDALAAAATVSGSDRVMLLSQKGNNKTIFARSLPRLGRTQKGEELIAIRGKDKVINLITLAVSSR